MDSFDSLIGNDRAKASLRNALKQGKYNHTWLFSGPEGVGKSLFALAFVREIALITGSQHDIDQIERSIHPDVHVYRPEGKVGMYSIDTIREISNYIQMGPSQLPYQIYIFHDAHRMLASSSNALLKVFEEPPTNTVILLISHIPEKIIATVRSRCRNVYFGFLAESELEYWYREKKGKSQKEAALLASKAHGRFIENRSNEEFRKAIEQKVVLFLNNLLNYTPYTLLSEFSLELEKEIELRKKEEEKQLRKEFFGAKEDLSPIQKDSLEKKVQGELALWCTEEVETIFQIIILWFRDLLLHHIDNKNPNLFTYFTVEELLPTSLLKISEKHLDKAQQIILIHRTYFERGAKLSNVFEALFFEIQNFLKSLKKPNC